MSRLRKLKAGELITEGWIRALVDAVNSCSLTVGQGGSLNMNAGPDGYTLDAVVDEPIWGQTTGAISGGTYPFKQVFPDASGAWTDGALTDTAYEVNGNTSVTTGKRGLFWRTAQGTWAFNAGTC